MTDSGPVIGVSLARSLVEALGSDCAAGAVLAARFEGAIQSIRRGTSIDGVSPASIDRAARDFARRGWLEADGDGWRRSAAPFPPGLGTFLLGAEAMRSTRVPDAETLAVVTLPEAPSAIARILPTEGPIHASIGRTEDSLNEIARAAVTSLTVMSPFVNREGGEFTQQLFDNCSAPRRTLITRRAGATRLALEPLLPEMASKGITVLDYLLPAEGGFETFHAKIVIADGDQAYVGSANMTRYARHSMELGVIVKGRAARAVAALVRAVERISVPVVVR